MTTLDWLPLNDFSAKYKISLSTLRRRIRSGEIQFRFEEGKYWLADKPIQKNMHVQTEAKNYEPPQPKPDAENLLSSANQLLQELKSAYVFVLHEKEDQIMELKEELADLKTLVKILESENDRLNSNAKESTPIDSWLDTTLQR